jgi:iron complex outermembrane receptor protein
MKFTLRGASSAALLIGLAGVFPAWAQDTITTGPQPPAEEAEEDSGDRVVVTGSFIQGTPEDAALPVEVFSQEELEEQGAPTALEFAKSLTISGPTTGEAYYFSGAALTGSVNYNLRGLGADKTLVLLNGRRMSQNTSNIPSAALARTEVLKDGAAVIYGADATGGVVNFITRDDFVGMEVGGNYKYIDGSDGDYGLSILGGIGDEDVNFLWAAEWEHRSRLESEERDWAAGSYGVNPSPWSPLTNVASWLPRGTLPVFPGANPLAPDPNSANGEYGTPVAGLIRDFTQSSCEAVGGVFNPNGVAAGVPSCSYNYASYYNLVEENDIYRAFAQINANVNENMDFHMDVSYGQVMSPQVFGSPAQPVIRGPARSSGATYQFYAPSTNPFVSQFLDASVNGTTYTAGARAATQGVTPLTYRAFAHGGNPFFGEGNGFGVPSKIDNQIWRVSAGLNGNLGDWAGMLSDVGYDFALTYNQSIGYADSPDVIGHRLQEALAGFGGPNCSVVDQNPYQFGTQNTSIGTSAAARAAVGCYYWNPFASSFATQPELGLANPRYVAGAENREDVARWLFDTRATETINSSLTADIVFNGMSGIQLPGGEIGWAIGGQSRQLEFREIVSSPFYNGTLQCDWPEEFTSGRLVPDGPDTDVDINNDGIPDPLPDVITQPQVPVSPTDPRYAGCTPDGPGPFVFFGTNVPDYADQQQYSLFGELQIPLLDNVNFQAAVRREEFSGGLGATVYKVSGKWDVWGPLSLRGSYGTNYQAPPAGLIPGELNNGVLSYTRAAGSWLGSQTLTRTDVVPETATAWNMGVIWQSEGFAPDHDLSIIVDYFDIETEDELGVLASNEQIANGVFRFRPDGTAFANQDGTLLGTAVNNGTALADCSHPLISRITFNSGACVQGTTNALQLNSIRTDFGNGPGQHIAGYDINVTYTLPLGPGDLTANVTATKVEVDENTATILDGFQIAPPDDRLGFFNFATVGNSSPELRLNASLNYGLDQHNFRLGAQFVSSVTDERGPTTPGGFLPGTTTPYGLTDYGVDSGDWLSFDFTYLFRVTEDLRLTATVQNIMDEDPPESRQELGYDPRMGSPLGRTFELGVKKVF